MNKDELMIAQLREVFAERPVDRCLAFDIRKEFYIYEDETSNRSFIFKKDGMPGDGFLIINPKQKSIRHLSIDHCFFTDGDSYEGKRCDCVVFDDHNFCFIELKLNVKWRKATDQLREAREQIGAVIEFFKEAFDNASKGFLGFELEAFVVMRQHIYPRNRANRSSVFVEFLEKYGVTLFEQNCKKF